jgi:hypothetical protein
MAKQLALVLALTLSAPALAQGLRLDVGQTPRTITVAGDAVVPAPPDRALVTFGVETEGQEPRETLRRHEEEVQRVLTAVRRMRIADREIEVQSLSLGERYDHTPDGRPRRTGYVASRTVTITLDDLTRVPDLVSTVVQEGANRLYGLAYTLRDADRYEDEALREAYVRAREKADQFAAASGVTLGRIVAAQEQGTLAYPPVPMPMANVARMEAVMADGAGGAYSTGAQEVRAAVVVTFQIQD